MKERVAAGNSVGGVALVAHVTGFLAGLALLPLLRRHARVDYRRWDRWLGPRGLPLTA